MQYPDNIKKQASSKFVFNAIEGEALQSQGRTILFVSEKQNRDVWVYADKKNDVVFRHDGEDYQVIDGELKIDSNRFDFAENGNIYGGRY